MIPNKAVAPQTPKKELSLAERKEQEIFFIPSENISTQYTADQQEQLANLSMNPDTNMEEEMERMKDEVPLIMLISAYRLCNITHTLFIEEAYKDLIDVPLIRNYYNRYNQNENLVTELDIYDISDVSIHYYIRVAYDIAGFGDFALIDTFDNGKTLLESAYIGNKKSKMISILEHKAIGHEEYLEKKIQSIRDGKEKVVVIDGKL